MKLTYRIFVFLFFTCSLSYGQMEQYRFKREIKDVTQQWNKIILPDNVFGKTTQSLADIRIFGITTSNDTIEAPYLLRYVDDKTTTKEVAFKTLNTSRNDNGYYVTFEISSDHAVNQIELDFKQENFDWEISLEGSQDQGEWFTVLEGYRIMSIENALTNFQFTKLTFPSSKYRFYRLHMNSKEKPVLTKASIVQQEVLEGRFRDYPIKKINTKENKQARQSEIDLELQLPGRISKIKLNISDHFDFYRPITIRYQTDSVKTAQGWKYNYRTLASGTLNSMEENEFNFNSTTVHKLKIVIENQDNQPLTVGTVTVRGYEHELLARFTEEASYFFTYGNETAARPNYDLERFADNVPESLTALELGEELGIAKGQIATTRPLFESKVWLWVIMTVIILLLGWFTVSMIRNTKSP